MDATDIVLRNVLAVGRLPAASAAELRRVVTEIMGLALWRAGRRPEAPLAPCDDTPPEAPKPKHLRHLDDGQFE